MTSIVQQGIAAGMLIALTGCASITPIGVLLSNPARYDGKTVKVEGRYARQSAGWDSALFRSATIAAPSPVISQSSPPPTGARIGVKGRFESFFTLGTKSLAVLREESRTTP